MGAQPITTSETEQIVMTFSNGQGNKYTWHIQRGNEKASLTAAAQLQQKIAGIEISKPDDQEATWAVKDAPHYQAPQIPRVRKTKTTTTVVEILFEAELDEDLAAKIAAEEAKKHSQRNWLFTPANVELWRHETLVKKLKAFYQESHDADTFLAYLRMLLLIYRCDFLDLDKKVAPGDFYDEVREIYNLNQQWSYQMMAALPELGFMFSRFEFASLKDRLAAQNRRQSKEMLAKTAEVVLTTTPVEAVVVPSEEVAIFSEKEPAVEKKRPSKAARNLLKKYTNQGKKAPKKRGLFF